MHMDYLCEEITGGPNGTCSFPFLDINNTFFFFFLMAAPIAYEVPRLRVELQQQLQACAAALETQIWPHLQPTLQFMVMLDP